MPEPITIGVVGVGAVAGWRWLQSKLGNPAPPPAPPCDSAAAQAALRGAVGSTASGAAAGSAVPGVGTGVGAGAGAALGVLGVAAGPCGAKLGKAISAAVSNASKTACQKADIVYAEIRKKGGSIPGYERMTCDQKLAACLAAASPLGVVVVGITVAATTALSVGKAGIETTNRVAGDAQKTATSSQTEVGGGHATVGGHKIY